MDWIFGKKPTLKEQQRENDRALRKAGRDIERDRREMEREEKKLEMEIKKAAKENNLAACKLLAKQLVQVRAQKNRALSFNSKIQGISSQNRMIGANAKLAGAVSTTAQTMKNINSVLKPEQIAGDMRTFQQASMKMDMTEELINDTLDDIMNESGDEEESDAIVNKVLDEIGIEISGKMAKAPAAVSGSLHESTKSNLPTEEELEQQLARLRN
ncbi:charged multivesicular body protein 2b [Rhodnius prolixus]|uniref:Putative assembly/vacuolar sorting protein n=1 Tax=Rhodnius prolixus TaxID=13249 RepID=R4G3M0_RHOPR